MVSILSEVDPFIGVDGPGGCLCGPYLPYSLVRLGPDTLPPHTTNGYATGSPIIGFSHTHVSGTGGLSRYGNIRVTPLVGAERLAWDGFHAQDECASPGYYAVSLEPDGIRCELTSTERVGFHRYTFPSHGAARILLDAGALIQPYHAANDYNGTPPRCIGGIIEKLGSNAVFGRGDFRGGWGHDHPYSVYFYARASRPIRSCRAADASGFVTPGHASGPNCRMLLGFGAEQMVELQVGISIVSIAQARSSVEREIGTKSFDDIRAEAEGKWEKMLSKIKVTGGTAVQRTLFHTLFTRLVCMPTDLGTNDEFPLWHSNVRHFTDFYCLWDSVRNANSLIALIDPEVVAAQINCLIDVADHTGWLPDGWIAGHRTCMQGGSSADILFAEAALKELPGINYEEAFRHVQINNEEEPSDVATCGRYLAEYRRHGYLSTTVRSACVSRHLEYAYQTWCASALAKKLGCRDLSQKYESESMWVWNLWRESIRLFAPRDEKGRWVDPFDPAYHWPDRWNDPYFYEGNSWQWSFQVLHDIAGLIRRHGGAESFIAHLDAFFEKGYFDCKETMMHIPYLYHYAGRPDRSVEKARWVCERYFKSTRDGLSDNEDMGCQSAFYMCSSMGLYPVMGQDLYLLTAPIFRCTEIQLGSSGSVFRIESDGDSADAIYITAAELNGKALDRAWLRHSEIIAGGTLRLCVSAKPSDWGSHQPPPSPISS